MGGTEGAILTGLIGGGSTAVVADKISISPKWGAAAAVALSVAAYEAYQIIDSKDFKFIKTSGPFEQQKDIEEVLEELKIGPSVPMDPEEYFKMIETLGPKPMKLDHDLNKQPEIARAKHDEETMEIAKEELKEWGIAKEGDVIEDVQLKYGGRKGLIGDLKIGKKIIEIELPSAEVNTDQSIKRVI